MYIRATTLTYDPTQEDKVLQVLDEQMIPVFRQLSGFVSYTGGLDRTTGRGVAITIWDNMDHATGFRAAIGGIVQQFEAIGVHFDPPQLYELIRQV
ncbi:MAG: hypothetical protein U0350_16430 [Caldilineaceae bacterium]